MRIPQEDWPSALVYKAGNRLVVYRFEAFDLPAQVAMEELRGLVTVRKALVDQWAVEVEFGGLEYDEYVSDKEGVEAAKEAVLQALVDALRNYGVEVSEEQKGGAA